MGSLRIQFNVHIEQRVKSKEVIAFSSEYMNHKDYIVHTIPYLIHETLEDMKRNYTLTPPRTNDFYCCTVAADERVYAKQ